MLASALGIIPSRSKTIARGRLNLCEAIAIQCSLLAERGDLAAMEDSLEALWRRNPEILSAVLVSTDGTVMAEVGDHVDQWGSGRPEARGADADTRAHLVEVPLVANHAAWGVIELAFPQISRPGWRGWLDSPVLRLFAFIGAFACLSHWIYLSRVLQHLNPSKVIPPRVRATLDTFAEGLLVMDNDQRIILANAAFANAVGEPTDQLQGRRVADLAWATPLETGGLDGYPWADAVREQLPQMGRLLTLVDRSERARTYTVNASPILDEGGTCHGVLASFDDMSVLEQRNAELQQALNKLKESRDRIRQQNQELKLLATRDPLTSCLNRRAFYEQFEHLFNSATRYGHPLSCVLVDIDHFKSVNDVHGHSAGDEVLRTVARVLNEVSRESDLVCRYGGEEFCVLLPHLDVHNACQAAERFREAIASAPTSHVSVTASLGVSAVSLGAGDPQKLLDQADQALYVAKRSGRNRVVSWVDVPEGTEIDPTQVSRTAVVPEGDTAVAIPFHAVTALSSALAYRDAATAEHSRRVADLCVAVADGLPTPGETYVLEIAALLHDIGKVGVPDAILLKPGKLTEEEWKVMSLHDQMGVAIIQSTFACDALTEIVKHHHAAFGGSTGNPELPQGTQIHIGARILTIADAYDAMVSDRVYRKGMAQPEAFAELRRCAGKQFDPELVDRFIDRVLARDQNRRPQLAGTTPRGAVQIGLQIEHLAYALDNRNPAELAALAERLKRTATQEGIQPIIDVAAQLEAVAHAHEDWGDLVRLTSDLLELCRMTQRALLPTRSASP